MLYIGTAGECPVVKVPKVVIRRNATRNCRVEIIRCSRVANRHGSRCEIHGKKCLLSLLEKDTKEPDDVSEKNHNNDSGDDGYNGALHVITLRHQQYLNLRYFSYRGLLTSHFALRAEFDFLSSCHEFLCDKSVPAAIRAIVFNHFRSSFR